MLFQLFLTLIISNIYHFLLFCRANWFENRNVVFLDTFIGWNMITMVFLLWVWFYVPDPQRLDRLVSSFIR